MKKQLQLCVVILSLLGIAKNYAQDISTAFFLDFFKELNIASQENTPTGITFNNDGTKMFVIGYDGSRVVEYNLGVAFDISTAIHAGLEEEFSIDSATIEQGLSFNADGTKMFVIDSLQDVILEYSLSMAFDVSTATYTGSSEELEVPITIESNVSGITFNNNGDKLYLIGTAGDSVIEYVLTSPYDISTAQYLGAGEEFDASSQEQNTTGLTFNDTGSKLFIIGTAGDSVVEYNLTGQEFVPKGLSFNADSTKMFIIGFSEDTVFQYALATSSNITQTRFVEGTTGVDADTEVTTNNYNVGDEIIIRVDFDGPVVVEDTNGTPYITITSLGKNANYVSTSGQSIYFLYTIVDGDNITEVTTAPIISLNQATSTIKNDLGVDADLGIGVINNISPVLSIIDNVFTSTITVSPNPVINTFNINLSTETNFQKAQVYSIMGKEVIRTQQTTIDASNLSSGIYLLKVTSTDNKIGVKKFIKK